MESTPRVVDVCNVAYIIDRSPLLGASISHINPVSQPLRVSFYLLNTAGLWDSRALFLMSNKNNIIVMYCASVISVSAHGNEKYIYLSQYCLY